MSKGQISDVFKYIFGLIVGGIFLLFFIWFAYNYMNFAGGLNDAELVVKFNDDLSAYSVSYSADKMLSYKTDLKLNILEGKIISNEQYKSTDKIIFAPLDLDGKSIWVGTREIDLPYPIGNAFYLDDGKTMYVYVYDQSSDDVLQDLNLPSFMKGMEVNVNSLDLDAINSQMKGYDKVKFVFFTKNSLSSEISEKFEDYEIYEVTPGSDYEYGKISFDGVQENYYGYPMLIGGIVCEDSEAYEFNRDLIFEKTRSVTNVYLDKAKFLSSRLPMCDYSGIKVGLNNYYNFIGNEGDYKSKVDGLMDLNKGFGGDCVAIF